MALDRASLFVPRRVTRLGNQDNDTATMAEGISVFRDQTAWVLLAEPGAGKTCLFEEEAKAMHALGEKAEYLSIGSFVNCLDLSDWRGKTLFLDGLDEYRGASGGEFIIDKICAQLQQLGRPKFRLSCRAADWFGSSDRKKLAQVSGDGSIVLLQLESLSTADIKCIL